MILEPILSRVGFPMVADVPGVGEHLGNDGVVMVTLNRSIAATFNPNLDDLYAGGAFTPYPNASANPNNPYQVYKSDRVVGWMGNEMGLYEGVGGLDVIDRLDVIDGLLPFFLPTRPTHTHTHRCHQRRQTTLRFGQLIGVDKFPTSKDFSIGTCCGGLARVCVRRGGRRRLCCPIEHSWWSPKL